VDKDEFRNNIEQFSTAELERRLAIDTYSKAEEIKIVRFVINDRRQKQQKERIEKRDAISRRTVIAAWISAVGAIISAISAALTVSHNSQKK
jgi:hypothetical protein